MKRINSNFCIFLIALTHLSIFLPMGMNVTALNPTTPALEVFTNDSFIMKYGTEASAESSKLIITLAQAILVIGAAVGSLSARLWLKYLSRRGTLIVMHVLALASSILMGPIAYYSSSYEIIIIGRLMNGIARGVGFTVGPLYVAEITSRKTLALYQSSFAWLTQVSSAIGNFVGHPRVLGGVQTWPYALAMPGILSFIYLCCIPWIPHTLTWTIQKERRQLKQTDRMQSNERESFALLRKLRYEQGKSIAIEYQSIESEIEADAQVEQASVKELLSIGKYRRQLFAAVILVWSLQATGSQAIFQYTNPIFEGAGIRSEDSTYYTIGLFALMTVTSMFASAGLNKKGPRKMLLSGLGIVVVGHLLLITSTTTSSFIPEMAYVSVASVIITMIGIGIGPMLCLSAYPSEVTTQITRPNALWIGGVCFWITAAVVAFVVPYSLSAWGGFAYIPFIVLMLLVIAYVLLFVPETHGRSVASIQRFFEDTKDSASNKPLDKLLLPGRSCTVEQISLICENSPTVNQNVLQVSN